MDEKSKGLIFVLAVLAVIIGISVLVFIGVVEEEQSRQAGCPQENMTCEDGTVVSRVMPWCEFEKCP